MVKKGSPSADDTLAPAETEAPVANEPQAEEVGATEGGVSDLGAAIDRGITNWVRSRLSNSTLSRHTESWNLLHKEFPQLKALILKEVQ